MKKPQLESRHDEAKYTSYIVGFVLSVAATLIAYFFVVNQIWPKEILIYVVMAIAVIQLIIQSVFFLHIGRGSTLKSSTFLFALLIVVIVVGGSLWIMHNLDYNMMQMTPEQMELYMHKNQGL